MSKKKLYSLILAVSAACLFLATTMFSKPQSSKPVALAGIVTSDAEGPMEGVIVKAKRVGGTITISVVSDEHGRYSFPADKLKPGPYNLTIRAAGYEIPNKSMAITVANNTTADLKLSKASPAVLVDQLMPAEVVMSLPGTPAQVRAASGCGGCHGFSRVLKSTHDADEIMSLIVRMRNHEPAANDTHPINLLFHAEQRPGEDTLAKYLASINLSAQSTWNIQFKTLPRPMGKATKVIYTEY